MLQLVVPESMLPALGALCGVTGCRTPDDEPLIGELVMRGLRLLELLAARKARGDERVTVMWNQGAPQPTGIVLPPQLVAGARSVPS